MPSKVPLRHLSIRVPWHDPGWVGVVCKNPKANAACLALDRIRQTRKDNLEMSVWSVDQVIPSTSGDDQILATFKIAANAAQGSRQVKVKVRGVVSNALDFLVQVPDAVKVETMGELQKIDPGPGAVTGPAGNTILTNQCGAYRTMVYQLVDKGGTAIKDQATMRELVIDTSTNQTVKDKPYDTDESGRFGDVIGLTANYPACPSVGTNINLRQTFTAKIGDKTFNLSTVRNITIQKTSATDWAITVQ